LNKAKILFKIESTSSTLRLQQKPKLKAKAPEQENSPKTPEKRNLQHETEMQNRKKLPATKHLYKT
jgi:hypothetical protein